MSKLLRFLSGRWTTRAQNGSDAANQTSGNEPGTHRGRSRKRHSGSQMVCRVALLDGTDIVVDLPVSLQDNLCTDIFYILLYSLE